MGINSPDVTAIILNYEAPEDVLERCALSVIEQSIPIRILIVDNASRSHSRAPQNLIAKHREIRLLQLPENLGFAGGMNEGVRVADTPYVLPLNNDAELTPDAISEMLRVMEARPSTAAVAPKILFASDPDVIAGVGMVMDRYGVAFDRGIGQVDAGQYDASEQTFGASFAAALIRAEAISSVGLLDESFFMYYEDVDWCFRAGLKGFAFHTAPRAIVRHVHSMSTKHLDYAFKYRLMMRNRLWMILKNFSPANVLRASFLRAAILLGKWATGPARAANLRALFEAILGAPRALATRREIQKDRLVSDEDLFRFSEGESPFFDDARRRPQENLEMLRAVYRRLEERSGKANAGMIRSALEEMLADPAQGFPRDSLLQGEPERVKRIISSFSRQQER